MQQKGHRSARGELVDMDLLKIKQQIASAPTPLNVQVRENFIDQQQARRLKRLSKAITIQPEGSPGESETPETTEDAE